MPIRVPDGLHAITTDGKSESERPDERLEPGLLVLPGCTTRDATGIISSTGWTTPLQTGEGAVPAAGGTDAAEICGRDADGSDLCLKELQQGGLHPARPASAILSAAEVTINAASADGKGAARDAADPRSSAVRKC